MSKAKRAYFFTFLIFFFSSDIWTFFVFGTYRTMDRKHDGEQWDEFYVGFGLSWDRVGELDRNNW